MHEESTAPDPDPYVPPVVDEGSGIDLGPMDVVFGILTLPLLFWALMYAVSGAERIVATPRARMKLYLWLLGIELVIAAVVLWWLLA